MRPRSIAKHVTPPHTEPIHMHASVHLERHPLADRLANELRRLPASQKQHCTSEQLKSMLTTIKNKTEPIHRQVCVHINRNPLAERLVNELRPTASDQSRGTSQCYQGKQPGKSFIICNTCNQTFTHKHNLRRHEIYIHQLRTKSNLRCRLCQKTFSRDDSLQRHLKFHQGERMHHCNICNKTFVTSACLKRHFNSKRHNRQSIMSPTRK